MGISLGFDMPFRSTSSKVLNLSFNDPFDRLPDSVLICIFNRVRDVKALGRCSSVCKRFHSVALHAEDIVVKVDCVVSADDSNLSLKGKSLVTHLFRLLVGSLARPLYVLHGLLAPKKCLLSEVSHHSPREVLKSFHGVRRLRIEVPGGELGMGDGVVVKWRAEFGSTLESCIILAASSVVNSSKDTRVEASSMCTGPRVDVTMNEENQVTMQDSSGIIPDSFFTNGGLKLRVVWTISSLIAASARHFLIQQIVCQHPTLESLTLADGDGQGTLCMNKQQLLDFQGKPIAASASTNRTQVPALNLKLWYAPVLDLPDGSTMKGATLVAIMPTDLQVKGDPINLPFSSAFGEPFCHAAGLLAQRRTYFLEMNSF